MDHQAQRMKDLNTYLTQSGSSRKVLFQPLQGDIIMMKECAFVPATTTAESRRSGGRVGRNAGNLTSQGRTM